MESPRPHLRPLRKDDAAAVLAAFRSNGDMARQGDVSTMDEARAYVERVVQVTGSHRVFAVADGGFQRLELGHRANNPASAAVARAAGFVHEGTERQKFLVDGERIDVLTYGRLVSDPWPEGPVLELHGAG